MTKITMPDGTIVETDDVGLALRVITPAPIIALAPKQSETPRAKKARRTGLNRTRPSGFKSAYFSDSHKLVREKMLRVAIVLRDERREMGREELHTAVRDDPAFFGTSLVSSYDTACRLCSVGLASSRKEKGLRLWRATEELEGMSDDEIVDAIRAVGGESEAISSLRRAPKQDATTTQPLTTNP